MTQTASSTRKSPGGSAPWTNTAASRPRKYTEWTEIGPGQEHPRVFSMSELVNIRASLRTWNATHRAVLSIRQHWAGTEDHPQPHFRVGWDASHTFDPNIIRTAPQRIRKRPKSQPKQNSESKTGEKQ